MHLPSFALVAPPPFPLCTPRWLVRGVQATGPSQSPAPWGAWTLIFGCVMRWHQATVDLGGQDSGHQQGQHIPLVFLVPPVPERGWKCEIWGFVSKSSWATLGHKAWPASDSRSVRSPESPLGLAPAQTTLCVVAAMCACITVFASVTTCTCVYCVLLPPFALVCTVCICDGAMCAPCVGAAICTRVHRVHLC